MTLWFFNGIFRAVSFLQIYAISCWIVLFHYWRKISLFIFGLISFKPNILAIERDCNLKYLQDMKWIPYGWSSLLRPWPAKACWHDHFQTVINPITRDALTWNALLPFTFLLWRICFLMKLVRFKLTFRCDLLVNILTLVKP